MLQEHDLGFVPAPPGDGLPANDPAASYLIVRLGADGKIEFQGSREDVEVFLRACTREGLVMSLDYFSWCG
jgi:hypothetical protein